jgi:hypothetical protein
MQRSLFDLQQNSVMGLGINGRMTLTMKVAMSRSLVTMIMRHYMRLSGGLFQCNGVH